MALRFRRKATKRKRVPRRNPVKAKIKYRTRTKTIVKRARARKNPAKSIRRRRIRRNPSGLKGRFSLVGMAVATGAGTALGLFGLQYIPDTIPVVGNKYKGIALAILGAVGATYVRNPYLKAGLIGVSAAGVVDLARKNIPMLALSEMSILQGDYVLQGDDMYALGAEGEDNPGFALGGSDDFGSNFQ